MVTSQYGLHEKPLLLRELGVSSTTFTTNPLTNSSTFSLVLLAGYTVLVHVTLVKDALRVTSS